MRELLGIARFRFHEGAREEYLRLSEQAGELVRANEPGELLGEPNAELTSRLAGSDVPVVFRPYRAGQKG